MVYLLCGKRLIRNYRAVLVGCTAMLVACSSPSDIDTPRKTTYGPQTEHKVPLTSVELGFRTNPSAPVGVYTAALQSASFDTSSSRLWLQSTWTRAASLDTTEYPLQKITIAFDSVDISGDSIPVVDTGATAGSVLQFYSLLRGKDIELAPDGSLTRCTMHTIRHDRTNRTISADIEISASPDGRAIILAGICLVRY